ncbi:MAG: hypothetical protein FWG81_07420, partial [Betaproteobacteria bacterium]|nr:hypothetical protein [Betaproteobacteria bacterium]
DDVLSSVAGDDDLEDGSDGDSAQAGAEDDPLDDGEENASLYSDSEDDGEENASLYSDSEDEGDDVALSATTGEDGEDGFSADIISFTGLNLDEPDSMNNGETVHTAGESLDGLMEELSSGFAEEDYLPDDGEWVDVTLAGVQLPEEGHYGL